MVLKMVDIIPGMELEIHDSTGTTLKTVTKEVQNLIGNKGVGDSITLKLHEKYKTMIIIKEVKVPSPHYQTEFMDTIRGVLLYTTEAPNFIIGVRF